MEIGMMWRSWRLMYCGTKMPTSVHPSIDPVPDVTGQLASPWLMSPVLLLQSLSMPHNN